MANFFLLFLLLVAIATLCDGTLSASDRTAKKKKAASEKSKTEKKGFIKLDEYEKKQMLQQKETLYYKKKNFNNPSLGYVTPWNGHGYNVAKYAAKKFTHISPVWFQVIPSAEKDGKTCIIEGTHDIDQGWIADVRSNNTDLKMVPRFIFERWSPNDYLTFLHNERWQFDCLERIINLILRNQFQGAVVEVWTQMIGSVESQYRSEILEFISAMGTLFHDQHLEIITTIPAELDSTNKPIGATWTSEMPKLLDSVDFVHVMTYDFKAETLRGVAPLSWIRENLLYLLRETPSLASKLFMGINFYGYQIKNNKFSAVTASSFKELLSEEDTEVYWDPAADEHFAHSKSRREMTYFPTTESLAKRLELAEKLGVGIGIWEIGQGFDYFTKIL